MRDFQLPLQCKRDLLSSGILRSEEWYFRTDVSGLTMGAIFKVQVVT